MAASYPSSVKTFTTKADGVDIVQAEHVNAIQDEIVALETELLTWTNYTPAWSSGITQGNGVATGRYAKRGKLVYVLATLTFGTTTSVPGANPAVVTLPIAGNGGFVGHAMVRFSANSGSLSFGALLISGGNMNVYNLISTASGLNAAFLSSTTPFTWTTNDVISVGVVYEIA